MTIWKFELTLAGRQYTEMPAGAEVLSADMQDGKLCIWAIVDPSATKERRYFEVYGTGTYMNPDSNLRFIGTVQEPPFVWHVFELNQ